MNNQTCSENVLVIFTYLSLFEEVQCYLHILQSMKPHSPLFSGLQQKKAENNEERNNSVFFRHTNTEGSSANTKAEFNQTVM